jgi:hypothetical protein
MIRADTSHGDASLQAAAIARWDNEGGACQMHERRITPKSQKYRRRLGIVDAEQKDSQCH